MGKLRMFLALELPATIREKLEDWSHRVADASRWKLVPADGMHLTLAFLGDVPPESASWLKEDLRGVELPEMRLSVQGYGGFPDLRMARTFWAGVDGSVEALRGLAEDVRRASARCAPEIDVKPFHPHITLARSRSPKGEALPKVEAFESAFWEPAAFCLFESQRLPEGSVYSIDARFGRMN